MRHLPQFAVLLSIILLSFPFDVAGQVTSRSGYPAPQESLRNLRRFPCGGLTILDENFNDSSTLPAGWAVIDVDSQAPRDEILFLTPEPGWQSIIDFKDPDSTNIAWASPAWYEDSAASDDYLITPLIANLPENVCLSWYAYSQDKFFPESYEIRISTTTPDTAGFLANDPVFVVSAEGDEFTYRSVSLEAYAGESIYIAFHHTSPDNFILVLDDIRLAEVDKRDISMFKVDPIVAGPDDDIVIKGAVINSGLDTVSFDSAQMKISYQIDNEEIKTIDIGRTFELLPNDTIQFVHDSLWTPGADGVYRFRVWVSGFGVDDNSRNDTLGRWQGIGINTAVEEEKFLPSFNLFPNPASEKVTVSLGEGIHQKQYQLVISDLTGRQVLPTVSMQRGETSTSISLGILPKGMYLITVIGPDQNRLVRKILKE